MILVIEWDNFTCLVKPLLSIITTLDLCLPTVTSNTFELSIQRQIKISSLVANMEILSRCQYLMIPLPVIKHPIAKVCKYTFDGGLQSYSKKNLHIKSIFGTATYFELQCASG